jgi:outer membrane protein
MPLIRNMLDTSAAIVAAVSIGIMTCSPALVYGQNPQQSPAQSYKSSVVFTTDTVVVSLTDAIDRAIDISPELAASEAETGKAVSLHNLAKASRFLTQFELTSAFSTAPALINPNGSPTDQLYLDPDVRNDWENGSLFSRVDVRAVQPLFTWGEMTGNIRAAEYGIDVRHGVERATAQTVVNRTAEMYFNLLLTEALYRVTEEAGIQVDAAVKQISDLIESGDEGVDQADLFDVQITKQEFIRGVIAVEQRRETAAAALSRQMILPEGTVVRTAATVLRTVNFEQMPLSYYQQLALLQRPEMDQVESGRLARNQLVTVAKSDYYPKLFLAANATYSYAQNRYRQLNPYVGDPFLSRSIRAGIGITQKLNFSQTRARVERARFDEIAIQSQQDALHQLILFEVESAYRNVIIASAAVEANAEALKISKEWLRSEQINFDLEIGDSQNLVRVVKRNLETILADFEARYVYNVAVLRLLASTGTLEASVQNGIFVE